MNTSVFLALMVIRMASEFGLPASVKLRMLCNVAFDFLIGLVPVIGDLLDIGFKANSRNAALLDRHLRERGHRPGEAAPRHSEGVGFPFGPAATYSVFRPGTVHDVEAQRAPRAIQPSPQGGKKNTRR